MTVDRAWDEIATTPVSRDHLGDIIWTRDTVIRKAKGKRLHRASITASGHAMTWCEATSVTFIEPGAWHAHDGELPTCRSCIVADGLLIDRTFDSDIRPPDTQRLEELGL